MNIIYRLQLNIIRYSLIYYTLQLGIQVILSGAPLHDRGMLVYQQYIDHLYRQQEPSDIVTQFSKGYEDYLQCPLQVRILYLRLYSMVYSCMSDYITMIMRDASLFWFCKV